MSFPKFSPTDEQRYTVEIMAGIGITQEDMADSLGIDAKTLRKHFRQELDVGSTRMVTKVAESLFRQAVSGNVGAACFILKCRAGWRERDAVEGKKAQRQASAQKSASGGRFAAPSAPQLVVDNK